MAADFRHYKIFRCGVPCGGKSDAALSGVGDVCRVFESGSVFSKLMYYDHPADNKMLGMYPPELV